jgi:hypothetical protein
LLPQTSFDDAITAQSILELAENVASITITDIAVVALFP